MTNKKSAKRAFMMSALSLLLCVSMLIGTTFAWFTDEVKSTNNKIVAGNLDIELQYKTANGEWADVAANTNVFAEDTLWEPGHTEVVYLRIKNAGTLALKYQLGVNIASEVGSVNVNGEDFKLSDYIYFGYVETNAEVSYANRDAARAAAQNVKKITAGYNKYGTMLSGAADVYVTLVVYMPETVGNEANYAKGENVPTINLGINLFATQYTHEEDSFDKYYDAGAAWQGGVEIDWYLENPDAEEFVINTAEQLAGFAAIVNGTAANPKARSADATIHDNFAGHTIKLGADLDLDDKAWTPIGRTGASTTDFTYAFKGVFDGQGHTIYNLNVTAEGWAGLFGLAHTATIQNVNVDGVTINGNRMSGTIVGQIYKAKVDNCHVKNGNIMVKPNLDGDSYDNGDKVGGIVGWIGDNNNNSVLSNCSVTNFEIGAYRDIGGIAGYVAYSTTLENNVVKDVKITGDQISNYYGDKDFNAGAIWGRNSVSSSGVGVTDTNNTSEKISITNKYIENGIELREDGVTNEVTLYLVPAEYEGTTVNVPEGVTKIGGYAFAYNSNIETIVLPSTVTTLSDRAFRDTSASTVELNEGLTNISYQAFRNATNVTEVVIPSTVTTISKEAFQNSGITTLTIPANVTTVEYGGCRDMKNLETVVIEGNVDIPVYAFRACTNLKTVILTGEDVTFGGGSRGMIFTNKENGDGSAITVYVANEAAKERLLAADTAAKDYGGYKIIVGVQSVSPDEEIGDTLTDGADTVYVPAGTYSFPASDLGEGDTVICAPGTVFEGTSSLNINGATVVGATFDAGEKDSSASGTINGTFKDCTFTGGSEGVRWCYTKVGDTVVFENCVFEATLRGIHFDGMDGDVKFINCEINGFNAIGGEGTVTFEGCTFGNDESKYNGLNMYCNTVLTNCTFNFISGKSNFIDFEKAGKSLTITNCTATLDGEAANVMDFVGGTYKAQTTITVDGVLQKSAASQAELNSALTGNVDVTLSEGNYTLPGVSNGDVTISGTKDTVITVTTPNYGGSDVTFNGVTVKGSGYATGVQHVDTVTYNDVTIVGEMCLYGEKVVFNNCTFELNGQYIWTYGAKEVEFINCTFNTTGKAILVYNEGAGASKVTVKGCTFNATAGAKAGAIANQNCAAIEIDNYARMAHVVITEGNTYSENFSGEWRIKNYVADAPVTVNGVEYTQIAVDGKLMTIDASKNVTVIE